MTLALQVLSIVASWIVLLGSILGAMTGSKFVDIAPWPRGEWEKVTRFCRELAETGLMQFYLVSMVVC